MQHNEAQMIHLKTKRLIFQVLADLSENKINFFKVFFSMQCIFICYALCIKIQGKYRHKVSVKWKEVFKQDHQCSFIIFILHSMISVFYEEAYQVFQIVPAKLGFLFHVVSKLTQFELLPVIETELVAHLDKRMNELLLPFVLFLKLVQALLLLQKLQLILANLFL